MRKWLRVRLEGIERVSLGMRLTVLVAVPLLVIVAVSAVLIAGRWTASSEIAAFSEEVEHADEVQMAIRAVQAEREATLQLSLAPLTGADIEDAEAALVLARAETDRAIARAELTQELDETPQLLIRPPEEAAAASRPGASGVAPGTAGQERRGPGQAVGGGAQSDRGGSAAPGAPPASGGPPGSRRATDLGSLRLLVDVGVMDSQVVFASYSNLIGQYQDDLFEVARVGDGDLLSASVVSYEQWQQATEWFAQVRVLGFQRLVSYDLSGWERLAQLSDSEEMFIQLAQQSAQPEQSAVLERLLEEPGVEAGAEARRLMLNAREGPPLISIEDWLAQTASRLAALNSGADFLLADGVAQAEAAEAAAQRELALIAVATAVLTLLVAFGAWAVTRSISRPLHRLALSAQLASAGHLSEMDVPTSDDAIGEIGSAIDELRQRSDEMADAASDIARGDLTTEIRPRSGHDRLGWALRAMTQRLGSMVAESEERSEQLAGQVDSLQETAHQDALTGLANRRKFAELLEAGIARARTSDTELGLLFIDLDGFKPVNDRLGHDVGDDLLRCVADRLSEVVGPDDAVGRYGGDEFTVVVNRTSDHAGDHLWSAAQRISDALTREYELDGHTVQLGASIGLARCPEHGESVSGLLRAADQAMYEAKENGGGIRVAPAGEAAA